MYPHIWAYIWTGFVLMCIATVFSGPLFNLIYHEDAGKLGFLARMSSWNPILAYFRGDNRSWYAIADTLCNYSPSAFCGWPRVYPEIYVMPEWVRCSHPIVVFEKRNRILVISRNTRTLDYSERRCLMALCVGRILAFILDPEGYEKLSRERKQFAAESIASDMLAGGELEAFLKKSA